jgi:hypothetical protein
MIAVHTTDSNLGSPSYCADELTVGVKKCRGDVMKNSSEVTSNIGMAEENMNRS